MEYPIEYLFSEKLEIGVIRVSVAATVICLDHGSTDGITVPDDELEPYFQPKKASIQHLESNVEYDVWHRPHCFVHISPKGVFAKQVKRIEDAIVSSIARGLLVPVQLRANLDGTINPRETWLNTQEFVDWCDVHSLRFDDVFDQYVSDERKIMEAAIEVMNSKRLQLESSNFESEINARRDELNEPDIALKLLRENIALREGRGSHPKLEGNLKNRERETLLNIIGVLLELIKSPKAGRNSDSAVIREMLDNYSEKAGIRERTLQEKFASAKKNLMSN